MSGATIALPLRIGTRTVGRIRRRLVRRPLTLADAMEGRVPDLPPLSAGDDGYLVTSLPVEAMPSLLRHALGLAPFVRARYERAFAALDAPFEAYLSGFSAKSRSTLKRKLRRFAEASGGRIDLRCYRHPDEMEVFYRAARMVSARTYQERRLGAGLPDGDGALAEMRTLAERDMIRGWILFLEGRPVSYLYAPAEGATLIYAYLGYDPDHAALSPGTVLQAEALRLLMAKDRFALFDFTEGEGQHKRLFATGSIGCLDLLLVRRTASNLVAGFLLNGFDASVAFTKRAAQAGRIEGLARRFTR